MGAGGADGFTRDRKTGGRRLDLKRVRTLVADDNPNALAILLQVLLGFGVRDTDPYPTVAEALLRLDVERYDLAIVDCEMSGQDGFELVRHVRSQPNGPNFMTPIIAVSGFTPLAKVERARDAGANQLITKPIVPSVLLNRIEWLARTPRQFINSDGYRGPDRRFHNKPAPDGVERRAGVIERIEQPEPAMSQDEVDSLFN